MMIHGQTRMLMREQITERARHHKLNSTDKAVAHMNQLENRELNKMVQEMRRTQRKFVHHMDQNRKQFKRMRRKSMGRVLLLSDGEAKFSRRPRVDKSKMLITNKNLDVGESSDDLANNELISIVETHEKRRASFHPQAETFPPSKLQLHSGTRNNPYSSSARDTKLPPIPVNGSLSARELTTDKHLHIPAIETHLSSSLNNLTPLPDIKVNLEKAENPPTMLTTSGLNDQRSPSVRSVQLEFTTKKEVTFHTPEPNSNALLSSGDIRTQDFLTPQQADHEPRRGSTDSNIPYILAYDEREIEEIEKGKKRNFLQKRLRRQSMKYDKVQNNVSEWIKEFDEQLNEQRRLENMYKDPTHTEDNSSDEED